MILQLKKKKKIREERRKYLKIKLIFRLLVFNITHNNNQRAKFFYIYVSERIQFENLFECHVQITKQFVEKCIQSPSSRKNYIPHTFLVCVSETFKILPYFHLQNMLTKLCGKNRDTHCVHVCDSKY